jgi:formate hydrogenlyase subunit 3/multisubunit Na+/H+ antiporter MnhD subunit
MWPRLTAAVWSSEVVLMFAIKNLGGIALLLAGITWLWLAPEFAGRQVSTSGALWFVTRLLSLLTALAFCVATGGLFTRHSWWESVALASAGLGLLALIPYWAAADGGGEAAGTVTWNAFVHVLMVAGVSALLIVPQLERWSSHHVMSG